MLRSLSLSVIRICVKCHLSHGLGSDALQLCNHSCAPAVEYVEDITGTTAQTQRQTQRAAVRLNELCCCSELVRGKYCLYPSTEKCPHRFLVDLASDRPQLHISRHPGEETNSSLHLLLLLSLFPPLFEWSTFPPNNSHYCNVSSPDVLVSSCFFSFDSYSCYTTLLLLLLLFKCSSTMTAVPWHINTLVLCYYKNILQSLFSTSQ